MVGVRAVWVLLPLLVGVALSGPPPPDVTKRTLEDIQFGNQQNLPIGLLDDNALPGAFPSSEASEEAVDPKAATKKEGEEQEKEEKKDKEEGENENGIEKHQEQEEEERGKREGSSGDVGGTIGEGGVLDDSRWHNSAISSPRYYRPHWGVPRLYSSSPSLPLSRRRRSPRIIPPLRQHHRTQGHHRSLAGLRNLMRAREGDEQEDGDTGRQKREADLDQLLKEVDVVELLNLLTHPPQQQPPPPPPAVSPIQPQHHLYRAGGGYGTVRYAPTPPRFAPQPKLFPDYEDDEGGPGRGPRGGMGLLKQNVRQAYRTPEAVMVEAGGGGRRMWRRSGGGATYGLSALPGFKRSAFRANTPPPSHQQPNLQPLSPNDVYSLAAMLGAELDPVTHRLRRAAM